jgi:MoxR-like ATPase
MIIDRTTGLQMDRAIVALTAEDVLSLQRTVRQAPVPAHVKDYVVRLLRATHPDLEGATSDVERYVAAGASPRGAQAMLLAAKIRALFDGRLAASLDDVRAVAKDALRHRIQLNFEGEAEGISTDQVIDSLISTLPETQNS